MSDIRRSGFAAIVGRPNVGKSTLINTLVGYKVAIVSPKPQTTRNRIMGVLNDGGTQIVFLDTPGLHQPKNRLGESMIKAANNAIAGVDAVLLVIEPLGRMTAADADLLPRLKAGGVPVILVINKIDLFSPADVAKTIEIYAKEYDFDSVVPVSAKTGKNTEIIIDEIKKHISEGPVYFPEDMITDQPERQMVAEIIREKMLTNLEQEVPHGIAVEVVSMEEREGGGLISIAADIYCERDSHKAIIIGKRGEMIKKIATDARMDIEALLSEKVYLECFVKVRENWRNSYKMLRNFGYE